MKLRLPKKKDPWTEDLDRQVQTRQSSCYERDQWLWPTTTVDEKKKGASQQQVEFSVVTRTAKH
jgi:hypothetical protein